MKISTRGRYGLLAMIDIASHEKDGCVNLKSVAKRQGLSENYLEQLITLLKKAGFVKSVRGAQGGYRLNYPANEISMGDILKVLEGSLYPVKCLSDEEDSCVCGISNCDTCVTKPIWKKMYESLNSILDNTKLDNLVDNYNILKKEELEVFDNE